MQQKKCDRIKQTNEILMIVLHKIARYKSLTESLWKRTALFMLMLVGHQPKTPPRSTSGCVVGNGQCAM